MKNKTCSMGNLPNKKCFSSVSMPSFQNSSKGITYYEYKRKLLAVRRTRGQTKTRKFLVIEKTKKRHRKRNIISDTPPPPPKKPQIMNFPPDIIKI